MKKSILFCLSIFFCQFINGQQTDFCFDYNNNQVTPNPVNSIENWQAINGQFQYFDDPSPNGNSNIYLRVYDRSAPGTSWAHNSVDFSGDWSQNGGDRCLCYDFRIYSGAGAATATPTSMYIYNGTSPGNANSMAVFNLTTALSITDGWVTICSPLQFADGNGNLPSNSDGQWAMTGGGNASDWNNLFQNVSGIALRLDLPGTSNPSEIYGYDNICMKECPKPYPTYDFDPCCPPLNKESMTDLFTHVPTGSITSPYQMIFTPTTGFITQMQAYIDYLNAINPSVNGLYFTWKIMDMGDGATPLTNYSGNGKIGSNVFNHFTPGGSTITNNTNFFPPQLEISHWYKIHVGMYLNDGIDIFKRECSNDTWFAFNYKIENQRLIGRVVDNNGKLIKSSEVVVGKKRNTIQKIQIPNVIKKRQN